jgi:hypothetical protein
MEPVAELVEQRDDLVVREQRRRVAPGRIEVADEIRDRGLRAAVLTRA